MTRRSKLSRMEVAIRIRDAVYPALNDPMRFTYHSDGPGFIWMSECFHIASVTTPSFSSLEVWPILNRSGLSLHPEGLGKVMNLHRSPYGLYEIVTFRRGDWERDLLRYVGAPLGLLTLRTA